MYRSSSLTQYSPTQVGTNRQLVVQLDQSIEDPIWADQDMLGLPQQIQRALPSDPNACYYSDITIAEARGSATTVGGGNYLTNFFDNNEFAIWSLRSPAPNWRWRKAAFWTPYSAGPAPFPDFPGACGIRDTATQHTSFIRKNCGLFFKGQLNLRRFEDNSATVRANVAESLDLLWVCGNNEFPGACDPTYSWKFCVDSTTSEFDPQVTAAKPLLVGLPEMIYTTIYDDELLLLNYTHVKTH